MASLNLLGPGLGLLPAGKPHLALALVAVQPVALLLLIGLFAATGTLSFEILVGAAGLLFVMFLATTIVAVVLTLRHSTTKPEAKPWHARWYAVVALLLAEMLFLPALVDVAHGYYKPFYIPAESMAPTLLKNDRIIASMRRGGELRRGDVILLRVGSDIWIKRVAGLPGDTIGMEGGIVRLNGQPVAQVLERTEIPRDSIDGQPARRLRERFPGEASDHEIYDLGPRPPDDFPETRVEPGHLFVLGDNRDMSADSRIPKGEGGIEQASMADVLGRPLYYSFGPSHRSGELIGPAPR